MLIDELEDREEPIFDHWKASCQPLIVQELKEGPASMIIGTLVLGAGSIKELIRLGNCYLVKVAAMALYMAAREFERRVLYGTEEDRLELKLFQLLSDSVLSSNPERIAEASKRSAERISDH